MSLVRTACLVGIALVVVPGVLALAGTRIGSGQPLGRDFGMTGDGLIIESRHRLSVCFDHTGEAGGASDASIGAAIESALHELQGHKYWAASGYAVAEPRVDRGCPRPPYALDPETRSAGSKGEWIDVSAPTVGFGSRYRLFMFLVDDAMFKENFDTEAALSAQEQYREGDQFWPVTFAMYIPEGQVQDHAYLVKWLQRALGLPAAGS